LDYKLLPPVKFRVRRIPIRREEIRTVGGGTIAGRRQQRNKATHKPQWQRLTLKNFARKTAVKNRCTRLYGPVKFRGQRIPLNKIYSQKTGKETLKNCIFYPLAGCLETSYIVSVCKKFIYSKVFGNKRQYNKKNLYPLFELIKNLLNFNPANALQANLPLNVQNQTEKRI